MKTSPHTNQIQRRTFLARSCALGSSLCFGCSGFLSQAYGQDKNSFSTSQDKISQNSGMNYMQVFNFAYRETLIPLLVELSDKVGREQLIDLIKTATYRIFSSPDYMPRYLDNLPEQLWSDVLDLEVVENGNDLRIYRITKCLWAKTFREANAGDLGYAAVCYGDYGSASVANEKLERETTLMQGHDHCLLKWTKIV